MTFKMTGALHQAKWMASALYVLIFILLNQELIIPEREFKGMKSVAYFDSLIYIRFWHEAILT